MGGVVSANCNTCSLSDELFLGGGMLNFDRYCNFPFACHDCCSLVCINLFEPLYICPKCGSNDVTRYDHSFLLPRKNDYNADNDDRPVFSWSISFNNNSQEVTIPQGKHKCAICLDHSLEFEHTGSFD
jgi:hypothetical protein